MATLFCGSELSGLVQYGYVCKEDPLQRYVTMLVTKCVSITSESVSVSDLFLFQMSSKLFTVNKMKHRD